MTLNVSFAMTRENMQYAQCSFCGNSKESKKAFKGPQAAICKECLEIGSDILSDQLNVTPVRERTSVVLPILFLESPVEPGNPVRCYLTCPACKQSHIDKGEWATKPHRTHLCEYCNYTWKPADFPTVGVDEPYSCGK